MDLLCSLERPDAGELTASQAGSSASVRGRVTAARELQTRRFAQAGIACNGQMDTGLARRHAALTGEAEQALREAYERCQLSARGMLRVIRVARTVADLAGSPQLEAAHVLHAVNFRQDLVDVPAAA
jgi:magnesium chelatase family protein